MAMLRWRHSTHPEWRRVPRAVSGLGHFDRRGNLVLSVQHCAAHLVVNCFAMAGGNDALHITRDPAIERLVTATRAPPSAAHLLPSWREQCFHETLSLFARESRRKLGPTPVRRWPLRAPIGQRATIVAAFRRVEGSLRRVVAGRADGVSTLL